MPDRITKITCKRICIIQLDIFGDSLQRCFDVLCDRNIFEFIHWYDIILKPGIELTLGWIMNGYGNQIGTFLKNCINFVSYQWIIHKTVFKASWLNLNYWYLVLDICCVLHNFLRDFFSQFIFLFFSFFISKTQILRLFMQFAYFSISLWNSLSLFVLP